MKKIISMVIIFGLLCTMGFARAQAYQDTVGTAYEKPAFRLASLGVMQGYEDGTFRPQNDVTRAEMAVTAVRMLGVSQTQAAGVVFSDVETGYWAAGEIEMAASMGLVEGNGDGAFAPEDAVRYEDAVKILVELLGYGPAARAQGGYPMGYLSQAASIGLLRGVQANRGEAASRGTVLLMVDRALDLELLERQAGNQEYTKNGDTLYDRLSQKDELLRVRGVVTANEQTELEGSAPVPDGYVSIDGVLYEVGASRAAEYLGYFVEAFVRGEEGEPREIVSIRSYAGRNETVTIKAEELRSASKLEILKEKSADGQERFTVSAQATYLYNGKRVDRADVTDELMMIYQGAVTLVSRDGSGLYDVVEITERESFIVDRTVSVNTAVYFETGNTFRKKDGFQFLFDDTNVDTVLTDEDDAPVAFGEIQKGDVISLQVSLDETLCRAVVSRGSVEGTVTELDSENGKVMIDGTQYPLYQNSAGEYPYIPELKDKTIFLLDAAGAVVGNDGTKETAYEYGYVAEAGMAGGFGGFQIKVATYGSRQRRSETEDNVETIYYTFQNKDLRVLDTAGSILLNGTKISAAGLADKGLQGNAVRYRLDSEGKVRELDFYDLPPAGNPYYFNAELLSFGGYTAYEGFLADESTKVILAPVTPSCDEDFEVDVEITDKDSVKAYPIEIDEKTQVAEAVILWSNMDSKTPKPIRDTVDVSIVGKVIRGTTEEGLATCKVQMLTGDKEVYASSQDGDVLFGVVANLKKGDLIKYNENSSGRIDNISVLASISSLGDDYYRAYENSPNEEIFGIVKSIRLNRLSNTRNEMVDEMTVVLDETGEGSGVFYNITRKDGPKVYLYDRRDGNIYASSTDEILGYEAAGTGASKVFMFVKNNEPSVVVIVRD